MSTNFLQVSDVGLEFESRNKLNAQSSVRHDASSGLCSESLGGGPFHVKQNRKHRTEGRYSSIGDGLESRISIEAKGKIDRLLGEIKNLSDVEKFVLYLKLPTGDTSSEELRRTPTPYSKQANRVEQSLAYTWIKSHLEEDIEICLPKQEVYDEYKLYCENHSLVPLCNADFGKLMKTVFPNVKPRRLGQRGQSRYCYGGLRKKLDVEAPSLPEIDISAPQDKDEKTEDNHLFGASCDLVLEWAMKLLEQNFNGMRELAEYLVSSLFVNSKSVSAFTVIAAMEETGAQKAPSMFSNTTGGDRHRETQLQLQRKLHERENVTRQKKKLQQMKEENITRQRQDRQTPQITSPTTPQELVSPRKIFEETEDTEMRTHSGRSSIQELCGVRPQRQRSTSSSRRKRTKSVTPQDPVEKGGGTSSGEEVTLQSSKGSVVKEDQINLDQGIMGRMSVDSELRRNSESDSTMEMMTVEDLVIQSEKAREESWRMGESKVEEMEVIERLPELKSDRSEKSIPMTSLLSEESIFQLPPLCAGGDSSMLEDRAQHVKIAQVACHPSEDTGHSQVNLETVHQSFLINSEQDIGVIPSVVNVQLSASPDHQQQNPDLKSGSFSAPSVIESISVPISSKPTLPSTTSPQLSFLQKEQQTIPKTSVSNRSAFVPFSQVRKDNPDDDQDIFSDPDGNLCLADKAQTILITENGKQFIIMTPRPNMLNLPTSSDPQDSQNQLVPITLSSNLPSTPVKSTGTAAQAEPQSPTTPKKNRSRFTPIRPKGSPAKTVSSILKEQKYPEKPDSEKIDRSKSVSTLLKEKREREAKMQFSVSTTVVPASAVGVASVGALTAVPATSLPLPSGENPHGEYIIILNPVNPGLGKVSLTSESVTSVTTTLTTASSHRSVECSSSTLDPGQRRERSRTASLSEYEITSPSTVDNLNSSDLSDSSVGDEKPSKLAKIVDSDQNVSSRPGSRCSVDRETPSILGRKRKLFSSQSIEGSSFIERHAQRVSSHEEDTDFTMEDDRRAMSCSLDDKERYSQREVSRAFDDKLKLAEKRNYPDISVLESDALKDVCIPDPSNIIKKGKELCKQKQDTGVGVTSLSLRKSQQRLLEEKPKLDERMKSFFQLKETVQTEKTEEIQDSELPPDVAEFITDSMTQAHLSEQMEVTMDPVKSRSLSRQEVVQEICKSLQNIPCNPSVLQPAPSPTLSSFPQRSHSAKNLLLTPVSSGMEKPTQDEDPFRIPYRSQSVTDASRGMLDSQLTAPNKMPTQNSTNKNQQTTKKTATGGVEFASPQRPIRRQRTPSVEKLRKRESSLERNMIQREYSVERNMVQTPHSDPGYGSVGPSPILHSVLVSTGTHVCDSTYSSMSSTSFSVCRPDSAHSVTSDGIIPSPMTSPRFQTSTPYHLKSPCVTPNQAPAHSEGLPIQSFMPIQGSSLKIDNSSVTLIRPVVTIASQISQSAMAGQVVTGEVIDDETIQSKTMKQAPPSYSAAMQDMERKSKKGNKQGAFKTLQTPLLNLTDDHTLSGPPLSGTVSSQSYYFSDKLAQLSKKTHASENKKVNEKTTKRNQSIKQILGDLTSPIDLQYPGQGQSKLQSLSQLPDVNYQGDQPNVNMFDIEGIVAYKNIERDVSLSSDMLDMTHQGEGDKEPGFGDQFTARRNLNEMLGHDLNGDDLQATLDDLKAVDSQYFADNFEFGSEKRQEI
ncbi:uncharacterized protein LOC133199164 [Saccostrea echinata]|uniref:uncharacterized protein LOC133199164 n=1 Tax=Saccostrea echinata TaxID=191078 RepID=UPI002A83D60A|nr:uncharacterized protein LOC133199164 [Saccostrea echinata]